MDAGSLQAAVAGEVISPGEGAWDKARQAWNLAADQHPELVVLAGDEADVATTINFARANALRVAPQSTGHGATSLGDLSGTILLRTARLSAVRVDPDARTVRAQAGAQWVDVIGPAADHGLVALHGMSGVVGVAGYTLGGGIGWLARREGFASTHVRSFEVVTADGESRHVDSDHEADLFWALRGGGGGPAVVTSIEFALFELREAFAGAVLWPIEQAGEIVHAYRDWTATVPDALTSTIKLIRFPPVPAVPEPLRGRALVGVTLAFAGPESEGRELASALVGTTSPYLDTLGVIPAAGLGDLSGDPTDPMPGLGGSLLLDTFSPEVADAFVELAGPGVDSPLVSLEIRHLGGALRSTSPDPGAAGPLQSEALVYGVGAPFTPELAAAQRQTLEAVPERLGPWTGSRGTLLTFDEQNAGLRGAFEPEVAARLAAVTAAYDPDGLLLANHTAG